MNTIKGMASLVLALVMAAALTSCGNSAASSSAKDEGSAAGASSQSAAETVQDYSGGIPWIDSDLRENISKDMPVDPKEDFHLYSTLEWLASSEIPEGHKFWSHYDERGADMKNQCIALLKDASIEGHDAELVYSLNAKLLDWDARNERGASDLQGIYGEILSAQTPSELMDVFLAEAKAGKPNALFPFVRLKIDRGISDSSRYYPLVECDKLLLKDSAEYSNRTDYGNREYEFNKKLFVFVTGKLGMDASEAENRFESAIAFEDQLAKNTPTTADQMQEDYLMRANNEMTWSDIEALSGNYALADLLEASGMKYDGTYIVEAPDYLKSLNELFTDDNLDGMKNVVLAHLLASNVNYLDEETYRYKTELKESVYGVSGKLPDDEMAFDMVNDLLQVPMQKAYVQEYGSAEAKEKVEDICRNVIGTYRQMLSQNDWASQETIDYAIQKLNSMAIYAAYPDVWPADYAQLDLSGKSLVESVRAIRAFKWRVDQSQLDAKVNPDNWADGFDILSCNAFYDPQRNAINMPIGMMGEPFFSDDMSTEELYASMGAFWVGHEVSHAFDSYGSQFDAEGNLRNWWSEKDLELFTQRVHKLDDYLDTIVAFGDYHVLGSNVDTEMAADMMGVKCALMMASHVEGFDYDAFFKKYAQMNAKLALPSSEFELLTQDAHPLDYLRTNVPVQQFEEFYETYGVTEGDAMYLAPENRIEIW